MALKSLLMSFDPVEQVPVKQVDMSQNTDSTYSCLLMERLNQPRSQAGGQKEGSGSQKPRAEHCPNPPGNVGVISHEWQVGFRANDGIY